MLIEVLDQFVKGTVFCVCSDNLAAHSLVGFSESFNVDKFCCFCLISKDQIATTDVKDFQLRTPDGHNAVLEKLRQNETLKSIDGVKKECVLGRHLQFFHTVNGFPPDILHDFFEGVIPYELCLCLKRLIAKGFFTLDVLNISIKSFPYKNRDKVNIPKQI